MYKSQKDIPLPPLITKRIFLILLYLQKDISHPPLLTKGYSSPPSNHKRIFLIPL